MLASRNAPLLRSFFLAVSCVCIVAADSLKRSHRGIPSSLLDIENLFYNERGVG
jgi:hypothetical protein